MIEGYKDSPLGKIPESWKVVKLEELGPFFKGKGISKSEILKDGKYPCIRYGEIYTIYDTVVRKFQSFIGQQSAINSNSFKSGDLLFTGSGETAEDIGKCVTYIGNEQPYASGDIIIHRPIKGNSIFLSYTMNSELVRNQTKKLGQGNSVVHIYTKHLSQLTFTYPPLPEQQKIAEILSTVDDKIEIIVQQITETQALKKGLMQRLLTQGIGHTEFKESPLGMIPVSWEVVNFNNVCSISSKKFKQKDGKCVDLEHLEQGTGRLIGYSPIEDKSSVKNEFNVGDVLFCKLRPYLRKYWQCEFYGGCTSELMVLQPLSNFDSKYLFYTIQRDDFIENSVSKSFGTKMPRTSWNILSEFVMGLPPLKEQQKIADILSSIDEKLAVLLEKKVNYHELKQGLMQQLLTGKIRVKV